MTKTAFITGATGGIGEALAEVLAQRGYRLILTGRNGEKLKELAKAYHAEVLQADLGLPDGRKAHVDKIWEKVPDLIINNAGFGIYGEVLTHTTRNELEMIDVNLLALTELSIEGARALKAHGKEGVIMNISSAAAFQIFPGFTLYAATKAFVNSFSQSFDIEAAPQGIRILSACPGMVVSNFQKRASKNGASKTADSKKMTALFAAEEIVRQIERKKSLYIFNWPYRLGTWISKLLPKSITVKILGKAMQMRTRTRDLLLTKYGE